MSVLNQGRLNCGVQHDGVQHYIVQLGLLAAALTLASKVGATGVVPALPAQGFSYQDALPAYLLDPDLSFGPIITSDNTPADNPTTDNGATLGRVLFYDKRLSHNYTTSCSSCHQQEKGFSDTAQLSEGFDGGLTGRHSMRLANARFFESGQMFWDTRAESLEEQALMPIQDPVEMGLNLTTLVERLQATDYYPKLFEAAFGDAQITAERVGKAIAQFERSMVSYRSKHDEATAARAAVVANNPDANVIAALRTVYTDQELLGMALFEPLEGSGPGGSQTFVIDGQSRVYANLHSASAQCNQCHATAAQTLGASADTASGQEAGPIVANIGLDPGTPDPGADGEGAFKAPSLRNVAVSGRFMHDGRFDSLDAVVRFYSRGIRNHPNLHRFLRVGDLETGAAEQFNFAPFEIDALVAFLETLTDEALLADIRFADPFVTLPGDYTGDGIVDDRDYVLWRDAFGQQGGIDLLTGADADGNGDGVVDLADYTVWRDNYGTTWETLGEGLFGVATAVPEPATLGGWLCAVLCTLAATRRRVTRRILRCSRPSPLQRP
ncbi:cytochrome c peroxidase [Botrimarina hoheduenensis]|uniref:Methylamine utilization protein MauG n=1 Tax=Botrimarina hoheduenensis TaxID=2528000 RepID=A0A5C5VQ99_9BACT|nr:cytochrome c peroxidase [Botrimarina hoheduenensis]TWT40806.1 Methylamine utilization protein MauG precursor [Botrimarina hoheduenensis]